MRAQAAIAAAHHRSLTKGDVRYANGLPGITRHGALDLLSGVLRVGVLPNSDQFTIAATGTLGRAPIFHADQIDDIIAMFTDMKEYLRAHPGDSIPELGDGSAARAG